MKKQAQEIGMIATPHKLSNKIVTCVERGRDCQGKFLVTRVGQTDTCIKCLQMLDGEAPAIIKTTRSSKNIWS